MARFDWKKHQLTGVFTERIKFILSKFGVRFIKISLKHYIMSISSYQKHELKKFIKELSGYKAQHTEFVSVYIPEGYDINKITTHLAQEKGTASNIKSSQTRKNVQDALERMTQHLKMYKVTPEHGLAVFSGNVSEKPGSSDVKVWSMEPPLPLKIRLYRCEKNFVLDILESMMETNEIYGLVVMDRREGNVALLKGKTIIPLAKSTSNVPGKTRAGGQSSQRFHRIREGAAKEFYRRLGEHMKEQFYPIINQLRGIIIGGPGQTKNEFIELGELNQAIKDKIIAIKDLSYTGDFGLEELLDLSQDVLSNEAVADEKSIMQKFFGLLAKNPELVTYGYDDTVEKLKMGAVQTLLVSEELEETKIDELDNEAKKVSTEVKLISTETREGVQLREMGKVASILRYEVY